MDLLALTNNPALGVAGILVLLVVATLHAPALARLFRRIMAKILKPVFSRFTGSRRQIRNKPQSAANLFDSEQQVGELQARLEQELATQASNTFGALPSPATAPGNSVDRNSRVSTGESADQLSGDRELVSRDEFGKLAAAVVALTKRAHLSELQSRNAQLKLQHVSSRIAIKKATGAEAQVLQLNAELRSLQKLVLQQHKTISKLHNESPISKRKRAERILRLLKHKLSNRSRKIVVLQNHFNKINKIHERNPGSLVSAQARRLRVQLERNKLDRIRELKAYKHQHTLLRAHMLPESKHLQMHQQISSELGALRDNNNKLRSLVTELNRNAPDELQKLRELRQQIQLSHQDLKARIEQQEHMIRTNSANTRVIPNNPAANDSSNYVSARHLLEATIQPVATAPHAKSTQPKPLVHDDLTQIYGIGKKLQICLQQNGITRFEQIAGLDRQGIHRLSEIIGCFPDRIERDRWVDSAKLILASREHNRKSGGAA